MLEMIHNDHRNLARLIKLLEKKVGAIKDEKPISYRLLKDVIDYMHEYADRYHHKVEDIIYRYYVENKAHNDRLFQRLEDEHAMVKAETEELLGVVDMILMDIVYPQDQFIDKLEHFIKINFDHMNYEEQEILPALHDALDDDDWQAINKLLPIECQSVEQATATALKLDPLFGQEVAERYRDLSKRLEETERERQ